MPQNRFRWNDGRRIRPGVVAGIRGLSESGRVFRDPRLDWRPFAVIATAGRDDRPSSSGNMLGTGNELLPRIRFDDGRVPNRMG